MSGTQTSSGGAAKAEHSRKGQGCTASENGGKATSPDPGKYKAPGSKSPAEAFPRPQSTTPASSVPPSQRQTSEDAPAESLFQGLPYGQSVEAMSVRQLREALKERGLSSHGLLEKREFQDLLRSHLPPTTPDRADAAPATASVSGGTAGQTSAADEAAADADTSTPPLSKPSDATEQAPNGVAKAREEGATAADSASPKGTPHHDEAPKASATPPSVVGSTETPEDSSDPLPKTPSATLPGEGIPPPSAFQESRVKKDPETAPEKKNGTKGEELRTAVRPRRTGRRVRFTPMVQGRPRAPVFKAKTERENVEEVEGSEHEVNVTVLKGLEGLANEENWTFRQDRNGHLRSQSGTHSESDGGSERPFKAKRTGGKSAKSGTKSAPGFRLGPETKKKVDVRRKTAAEKEVVGPRRSSLGSNSDSVKAQGGAGTARVKETARRGRGAKEDSDSSSDSESESDSGSGSGSDSESGDESSSSDESESEVEERASNGVGTKAGAAGEEEDGSSSGKMSPVRGAKQKVETEAKASPLQGSEQGGSCEQGQPGRPKAAASQAPEQAGASKPAVKCGRPVGRPRASSGPQEVPRQRKPRAVGLKTRVKRFWTSVRARARAQEQNASILRKSRKLWRLKTAPADQAAEARKRRIEARKAKAGEDDKAFALANRQKRLEALQAKALARRAAAKLRAEKAAAKRAAASQDAATAKEPGISSGKNLAREPGIEPGMQKRRRPSVSILEAAVRRQAARNLEVGGGAVGEAAQGKDDGAAGASAGSRFRVPEPEVPPGTNGEIAPGVPEGVVKAELNGGVRGEPGGSPGAVKLSPVRAKSVPRKKRTATRPGVKPQTAVNLPKKLTPNRAREGLPGGSAAEQRTDGFVEDDSGEEPEGAAAQKQADAVGIAGLSPEKEPAKAPVKQRVTGKRAARKKPTAKVNGKENVIPPGLAVEKRKEPAAESPEVRARKVKPLGDVYVKDEEVRVQKRAVLKAAKARRFATEPAPLRRMERLRNKAPSAAPAKPAESRVEEPQPQPDARTGSAGKEAPLEADVRTKDSPLATGRKTRGGGLKAAPEDKRAAEARGKAAKAGQEGVKAGKVGLKKRASRGGDAAADVSSPAGKMDGERKVGTAGKKRKSIEASATGEEKKATLSSGKKRRVSGAVSPGQARPSGVESKLARRKSPEQSLEADSEDEVVAKDQRKEKQEKRLKRKVASSDDENEERARKRRRKEKKRASRGEEGTDEEVPGRKHRAKDKRRHKHGKKHRRHKHRDEGESESERRRHLRKRKRGETEEERKQRRAERRERKRARREARSADKAEEESEDRPDAGEASGEGAQESDGARAQRSAENREQKGAEPEAATAQAPDLGHGEATPKRTEEASEEKDGQAESGPGDRTSADSGKTPGDTLEGRAETEAAPQADAAEETSAGGGTGGLLVMDGAMEESIKTAPKIPQVGTPPEKVVHEEEPETEPIPAVTQVELTDSALASDTDHPAATENPQHVLDGPGASTNRVAQSLPQETVVNSQTASPARKERVPSPEPEVAPGGGGVGREPEPISEQGVALVARGTMEKDSGEHTVILGAVAPAEPTLEKADDGERESGSKPAEESEKSEEEEWESAALDALLKFESGKLDAGGEATPQSKLKRSDVMSAEEKQKVASGADSVVSQGAETAPVLRPVTEAQTDAPASPIRRKESGSSMESAPESPPKAEPPVADVESVLDWVAAKGRCNLADISSNFAGTTSVMLEGLLQDLLGSFDIGVDNGSYFVL